jgi:ABC-type multidrug transport system ATPase subunit
MRDVLRELVDDGTTLLLTTQYLEEADRLADRIAVVDHGRVIASGSPAGAQGERAHTDEERQEVSVPVPDGGLFAVVRALDEARVPARDIAVRGATLDDVFLALTGHDAR